MSPSDRVRPDRSLPRNLRDEHHPALFRSRAAFATFPRNSAISTGPSENVPSLALAVRTRRSPPADLMSSPRCRIAAMTIEASCSSSVLSHVSG